MATRKKTARKAPKKTAAKAARANVKRAAAGAPKLKPRRQPETLRLRSITPSFTVRDIHRSVEWYTTVVGFVVKDRWEMNGALEGVELRAGSASLILGQDDWKLGHDRIKGVGMRLYCTTAQDVDLLAAGIKARGGHLDHNPVNQPWGVRDFGLTDPDGFKVTIQTSP